MTMTAFPDPIVFEQTWQQAAIALDCLEKTNTKPADDRLAYLIHAAVLFFVARDQQAFLKVSHHPAFAALTQPKPIRQLPTLKQLRAVLASLSAPPDLMAALDAYEDDALGVVGFHAFRDAVIQHGVPAQPDTDGLVSAALQGWQWLSALSGKAPFVTVS